MSLVQKAGVIQFYDTHPMNEDEILAKLSARGTNLDTLTEDELKDFDQDHYGGVHVVDVLAGKAGIRREHHVLDVCSGMGGPARWIAYRYGCRVTGLDFTESRVEAAKRLTQRVRLDHVVVADDPPAVDPDAEGRTARAESVDDVVTDAAVHDVVAVAAENLPPHDRYCHTPADH
jgi:SAM-dependent methyltransferase